MAIVKIFLESGETPDEVIGVLQKAGSEVQDEALEVKRFDDDTINQLVKELDQQFKDSYSSLMKEILSILKE